ncbi:MAG: hypothetical protein KDD82_13650 [Planctomycetes bacterium]|nr:hypothetical protein [Planctomycetota bacterium]
MKKLLVAGVVVLAVGGLVFAVMNGMTPEKHLADAAPAHTVLWVEGKGLEAAWTQFKSSEAFKDFERSKTYEQVGKQYEDMLEMAKQMAEGDPESPAGKIKGAGLDLDHTTLFDFFGQGMGIGLLAPEAGKAEGKAAVVFMTEVDMTGLATQLAMKGEWSQIWAKLTGAMGEDVEKEAYEGYEIMWPKALSDAPQKPYMTMAKGVFAVSNDKGAIQEVIKVAAGKAKGLGEQPRFKDEASRLPRGNKVYGWLDLDFLRNTERLVATAKQAVEVAGGPPEAADAFKPAVLEMLLADVQDARKGLAVAMHLDKGSPYQFRVSASRDANGLFKDNPVVDARGLITAETVGFMEMRDVYGLLDGYFRSPAWKKLADSKAGEWVLGAMKDLKRIGAMTGEDLTRTPVGELDKDPTFELRLALSMTLPLVQELLGNDLIASVDVHPDKKDPKEMVSGVACVRVRPSLRVLYDLAAGAAAAHAGEQAPYSTADHGKSKIFSLNPKMTEGVPIHWTRVGSVVLASNDLTKLQSAIDTAGKKAEVANPELKKVLGEFEDDYVAFVYFNQATAMKTFMQAMEGQMGEQEREAIKAQMVMYETMAVQAGALYVNEDYTESRAVQYQSVSESFKKVADATYVVADGEPPAWKTLPGSSFFSVAAQANMRPFVDWMRTQYEGILPKDQQDAMLAEAAKWLDGKDPLKFLEELGPAMGMSVISQPLLPAEGEASPMLVAVPGLVMAVQLKSPTEAEKTINGSIQGALDKLVNTREEGGSAVVGTLRTISTAQSLFREGDYEGDNVFDYGTLAELLDTGLIDAEVAKGKFGYRFTVEVDKREPEFQWRATASPIKPGTEARYYATDQTGVVFWMDKPFQFGENGEMPATALPAGFDEPSVRVPLAADDPKRMNLLETEVAGVKVKSLAMPEEARRELSGIVGKGLSPCWAFHGGYLLIASSQHAMEAAIKAQAGEDLSKSEAFKRAVKGLETDVVAFSHFDWAGVIDQVTANGKLIAENVAPPPADMKGPEMPQFPEEPGEDAYKQYEKDMDAYYEARGKLRETQAKWRKDNAEKNAASFKEILDSLKIFGSTTASSTYKDGAMITTTVSRCNLGAAE